MKTHAQAVVIGGGLIGCSILYHLAKLGWRDVVLFERDELTSGSTWHAAANIHGLHDSTNISRLQHYTMALYKELEKETGQGCGVFQPGSLYLAQTEAREHQFRLQEAKARRYKMNFYEVDRGEAERLHPWSITTAYAASCMSLRAAMSIHPASPRPMRPGRVSGAPRSIASRPWSRPSRSPMAVGSSARPRAISAPSGSSTRRVCGRERWPPLPGCNCR